MDRGGDDCGGEMMKLCKDCKFYQEHNFARMDCCVHPDSQVVSTLSGIRVEIDLENRFCEEMRQTLCKGGKLFEAKDAPQADK